MIDIPLQNFQSVSVVRSSLNALLRKVYYLVILAVNGSKVSISAINSNINTLRCAGLVEHHYIHSCAPTTFQENGSLNVF